VRKKTLSYLGYCCIGLGLALKSLEKLVEQLLASISMIVSSSSLLGVIKERPFSLNV